MRFFKSITQVLLLLTLAACSRGPAPDLESYDDFPTASARPSVSGPSKRLAGAPALVSDEMMNASYWGQGQAASDSACVRLNNYWCIKTPYSAYWEGQTGRDEREHAIFSHPAYGARAFARLMRAYHFKHGLDTPVAIISRYAPANDCKGWAGFHCPEKVSSYAKTVADGLGISPNESIGLFNPDGTMNQNRAIDLFRVFAKVEIGGDFIVPEPLIRRGIELEQTAYLNKYGALNVGPMAARPLSPRPGGVFNRWFGSNQASVPANFAQSDMAAGYTPSAPLQQASATSAPLPPFDQQASMSPSTPAVQKRQALPVEPDAASFGAASDDAFEEFAELGVTF